MEIDRILHEESSEALRQVNNLADEYNLLVVALDTNDVLHLWKQQYEGVLCSPSYSQCVSALSRAITEGHEDIYRVVLNKVSALLPELLDEEEQPTNVVDFVEWKRKRVTAL